MPVCQFAKKNKNPRGRYSPLRELLENSKPVREHLRSWLSLGAVIFAGVVTPIEYLDVKQEKRVERTLAYVERFGDGDYADSALLLDDAIDAQYVNLHKLLTNAALSPGELEEQYGNLIMDMFKEPEMRTAMNRVLRFQEELVQCVINELCDKPLTLNFFLNSTGDLLRTYYPYICDKRSKWNDPKAYQAIEHFYLEKPETNICTGSD